MGVETQPDVYMLMKDGQVRSLVPLSLDDPDPGEVVITTKIIGLY